MLFASPTYQEASTKTSNAHYGRLQGDRDPVHPYQNVAQVDVAMVHVLEMSLLEGEEDLSPDRESLFFWEIFITMTRFMEINLFSSISLDSDVPNSSL